MGKGFWIAAKVVPSVEYVRADLHEEAERRAATLAAEKEAAARERDNLREHVRKCLSRIRTQEDEILGERSIAEAAEARAARMEAALRKIEAETMIDGYNHMEAWMIARAALTETREEGGE